MSAHPDTEPAHHQLTLHERCAGLGHNRKAELSVQQAIKAARTIPSQQMCITESSTGTTATVQSQSAHTDGVDKQHVLQDPLVRYTACTCYPAVQQQMCKHQLAVLMKQWPGSEAARIMFKMLGSQLGRAEGCDPQHVQPLLSLRQALQASATARDRTRSS